MPITRSGVISISLIRIVGRVIAMPGTVIAIIPERFPQGEVTLDILIAMWTCTSLRTMPEGHHSPRLVVPTSIAFSVGILACIAPFITHKFLLLFFSAGSLWLVLLLYLYRRWWPGMPFVAGRRKSYRGIAVLIGFLIFAAAWYIIVKTRPIA
jgi:hypothetical protein